MNWLPDYRLKGAARDLYSNMQKARSEAIKLNRNTAITFTPGSNEYQICNNWNAGACVGNVDTVNLGSLGNGIKFGHGNATVQANNAATTFPLAPDDDVSYSSPDNTAVFNSRGFGSAGYVYLDHQENTTTYAIGSLSSGSIRILKWQGGTWK
jgi:type IV fimbrial biogenesis protein FimT